MNNIDEYKILLEAVDDRINKALRNNNLDLIHVGEALSLAADTYGSDGEMFERICIEAEICKSVAIKLVAIAESERIKQYRDKLSLAAGFETLYLISTFDEVTFEIFREMYDLDDPNIPARFISLEEVEGFEFLACRTAVLH
jgi:hypothetical protein